jgi:hypothetical protein
MVVWILTIVLTFAALPSHSFSSDLYHIQNFASTVGFLVEGDLKYHSLIIFTHASWIFCGSLYLILEMLVAQMGSLTNATSKSIRKTIGGMRKADNIIAQLVRLSPEEFDEVKERVDVISQSNSRFSRKSSIYIGKALMRCSRMSSVLHQNSTGIYSKDKGSAEDEN